MKSVSDELRGDGVCAAPNKIKKKTINYRLSIADASFDVRVDPIGDGDIEGPSREAIDDVEGEGTGEDDLQNKNKNK